MTSLKLLEISLFLIMPRVESVLIIFAADVCLFSIKKGPLPSWSLEQPKQTR